MTPKQTNTIPSLKGCFYLLLLCVAGCSTTHYKNSADKEAASILEEKQPLVPNTDTNFTIVPFEPADLALLSVNTNKFEYFGSEAQRDVGSSILPLSNALDMAVKYNRNYLRQKEVLYLSALQLSLDRFRFTPIFGGGADTTYQERAREVAGSVDQLTTDRSIRGGGNIGVNKLMRSGTRIAADFTTDFLRFVSGDPSLTTSSRLAATISQPLWRGAGYRVTIENLTQAERSLLYDLRDFTRFRREFTVSIAQQYYNVLQSRDQVRNQWQGYQAARKNALREKANYDEGFQTLTELGRFEQQELQGELAWIAAVRSYQQSIDAFKIQLGLPTDTQLLLDDTELANLKIDPPDLSAEDAIEVALSNRLDLFTVRDQYDDAERKIKVAANALGPDFDLTLSGALDSEPGNGFQVPKFDRSSWSAGLNLDLPLNRKAERNAYRQRLIIFEQARRALELAIDNVKLDILNAWRNLDQAERSYKIQNISVALAASRLEEQEILAAQGEARAQDVLDALNDFTNAQNSRSRELVDYNIARLQFWRDMGVLAIQEDGQWSEDATEAQLTLNSNELIE